MAGSPKKSARKKARKQALIINLPAIIPPPPPEPEETDRWGRPTEFKRGWLPMIRDMCEDGATDAEIAAKLGVSRAKLYDWRIAHPELAVIMQYGKALADDRLERTAYELAVGYTATVTESVKLKDKDGSERVVTVERSVNVPPDGKMLQWLMKNRRPDTWRDKTEHEHRGEVVHLTLEQARERLKARIALLKAGTGAQPAG